MDLPRIAYGTPRKLPKPASLEGKVVVLDIAFATNAGGASFEKVTFPFIQGLGDRLALWVDHHDHEKHSLYKQDPRFVLCTKQEHGACPEMISEEMVEAVGEIDTICCHTDFDGLCSAAKWVCGGQEPYPNADADARAIDTRIGETSSVARLMDRALRARHRDDRLKDAIVRYLIRGASGKDGDFEMIRDAAAFLDQMEKEAHRLSKEYLIEGNLAICKATKRRGSYDKTLLLMLGQERAPISMVLDESALTVAAKFDSGINLVGLLGLNGGMPTRVSVSPKHFDSVKRTLSKAVLR